ncbi:MAG TPA: spermine synthase [Bacteroidales bacterium]|nr:spermine synthase [Bacteroidales bacterium]
MKNRVLLAILAVGFSGIVVQILLLREFLIVFAGTELVIAIILANWLILEALGAFVAGKWIDRSNNSVGVFVGINLLFSLSFPFIIYATRLLKEIMGVLPGEGIGLAPIFISSLLLLAPLSFMHGALFSVSCRLHAKSLVATHKASPIGNTYIFETIGTIVGAVVFTYLFIPFFNAFQIALLLMFLNLLVGLVLMLDNLKRSFSTKLLAGFSALGILASIFFLAGSGSKAIHQHTVQQQWPGQNVVYYRNSFHGNITVTTSNGQNTFFADGKPIITSPDPDLLFLEEFVHLSLLSHPNPNTVLILSGGAGGMIHEILKHPVSKVVYTELDPMLLDVVKKFPTPISEAELNDPRVNVEYLDGRLYVKKSSEYYDVILVGATSPVNLQTNRLFTKEFFAQAEQQLRQGGILALSLPGSLTYLSRELKNINASVLASLNAVFQNVRVIPGDINLFLASDSNLDSLISLEALSHRFYERNLQTGLINPFYIDFKLDTRWTDWFFESLQGASNQPNHDFRPRAMFYSIAHWNALFSPGAAKVFAWVENLRLKHLAIPVFVVMMVLLFFGLKNRSKASNNAITFAIATSGFAGMLFELSIIYTFQIIHGYVFHHIGLLVTAFMMGIGAGGMVITAKLNSIKNGIRLFLSLELMMLLFAVLMPLVFMVVVPGIFELANSYLVNGMFFLLSALAGFLLGAQFPLASHIILSTRDGVSHTAGKLFGADLLGGWVGGLLGGVALLPVMGLVQTSIVVALLKLASIGLLVVFAYSKRKSIFKVLG